ncbi:ComEA family DNA-binding protein [Eggerthellaceae bacterium 3-80]
MGFLESVDSPATKLHLHNPKRLLLVGMVVVCAIVIIGVFVGSGIFAPGELIVFSSGSTASFDSGEKNDVSEDGASIPVDASSTTDQVLSENDTKDIVSEKICVHVSGCVVSPGVYWLEEQSRVEDALSAAGGITDEADSDAINRARLLQDGEQIIVFSAEEIEAGAAQNQTLQQSIDTGSAISVGTMQQKVNINTADQATLETLPGIGSATAQKIIKYRNDQGRFSAPQDIMNVSGIGEKKYEALADLICVS